MSSGKQSTTTRESANRRRSKKSIQSKNTRQKWVVLASIGIILIAGILFLASRAGTNNTTNGIKGTAPYRYVVGQPGPGDQAPAFTLEATSGNEVSLSDYQGKTVLLFFQEGLTCQACWDQVADLEKDAQLFKDQVGVEQMLVITNDPVNLLAQKAQTDGYTFPVLSDQNKIVSVAYDALAYGMMHGSTPGHTFILVDPKGVIRWRADYGGPLTNYVMYLPDSQIIQDMKRDLSG